MNKNKGGGVVFYVNDELGCEEIKNSIDKTEYLGVGGSLQGNLAGGFVLGLAGEVHQPSRSGADRS